MKEFTYTITNPIGIHARPAALLVKEAKKYASVSPQPMTGDRANSLQRSWMQYKRLWNGKFQDRFL